MIYKIGYVNKEQEGNSYFDKVKEYRGYTYIEADTEEQALNKAYIVCGMCGKYEIIK